MVLKLFLTLLSFILPTTWAAICEGRCEYDFVVAWSQGMAYRMESGFAFDVGVDKGTVFAKDNNYTRPMSDGCPSVPGMEADAQGKVLTPNSVITLDGVRRDVITINGQFPGPTIEVMKGTKIVVKVVNNLMTEAMTIHWHGIHQRDTPWMDGSAHIAQCPILPRQTFTYQFTADPEGTHWYHSHVHNQRSDGLFGMLIVHDSAPTNMEHHMMVQDWFHVKGQTFETQNPQSMPPVGSGYLFAAHHGLPLGPDKNPTAHTLYVSGLINGKGRFRNNGAPLSLFHIEARSETRFRVVNTGSEFGFSVSVDKHMISAVGSDGASLVPIKVHYIFMMPGESYDFIVNGDQAVGNYWIRARTMTRTVFGKPVKEEVLAVLRYKGASHSEPETHDHHCSTEHKCKELNCPFVHDQEDGRTCIPLAQRSTRGKKNAQKEYGLVESYEEIFLNLANLNGPSINGRRLVLPTNHMYVENVDSYTTPCPITGPGDKEVECTHRIKVALGQVVQIVISNLIGVNSSSSKLNGSHGSEKAHEHHHHDEGHNMTTTMKPGGMDHSNMNHGSMDHSNMDHSNMDHSNMDHSNMDHSNMDHSNMDHSNMDHGNMDHSSMRSANMDDSNTDHSNMDHSNMDHSNMGNSNMDHSKMDHSKHGGGCHEMLHAMAHTVHLHGYNFAVLYKEHPTDIICKDKLCTKPQWRTRSQFAFPHSFPVIKNTLVVPPMDYQIIRFRADNPGYWAMHCHTTSHIVGGMKLILEVEPQKAKKPPANFPSCGPFTFDSEEKLSSKEETDSVGSKVGLFFAGLLLGGAIVAVVIFAKKHYTKYKAMDHDKPVLT